MILSDREVVLLYEFMQWQHLPYDNPELQLVIRRMRTEMDIILAKTKVEKELEDVDYVDEER